MRTSELQYKLPPELIAQRPADRRDESRLLMVERATGQRRHEVFKNLPRLLPNGSLLVLNDTRVLPARLPMHRASGGRVEGLFLGEPTPGVWEIMTPASHRLKVGEELHMDRSARRLRLLERVEAGTWRAAPLPPADARTVLEECGKTPLPPYIRRCQEVSERANAAQPPSGGPHVEDPQAPIYLEESDDLEALDARWYQTVYARCPGAIAAPTAGLHFTPEVFADLRAAGMATAFVTLHIGVGTFTPIRCDDLADHRMHAEWYACPAETAAAVNDARAAGRPIVAVGTTSVRVLESCADDTGRVHSANGWTRLFICPPYRFRVVDKLLTNFHLPGSTLLAMVFALAGREAVLAAYEEAIRERYRFYSYGDAMLLL